MFLNEVKTKNQKLKIIKIHVEDNLWKFGIFENSHIVIIKQIYGNTIINFENHQYVIMKNLANKIEVKDV